MRPFAWLAAGLAAAGCCRLYPERIDPISLEIRVIDAQTGDAVTDAQVGVVCGNATLGEDSLGTHGSGVWCAFAGYGACDVAVAAPGYAAAELAVRIEPDFCGVAVAERREVKLERAGSGRPALVTSLEGPLACGQ